MLKEVKIEELNNGDSFAFETQYDPNEIYAGHFTEIKNGEILYSDCSYDFNENISNITHIYKQIEG